MQVVKIESIRNLIDRLSSECKSYNDEAMVMWLTGQLSTLETQETPEIQWRSMDEIPESGLEKEYLILGESISGTGEKYREVTTSGFNGGRFDCAWLYDDVIAWAETKV